MVTCEQCRGACCETMVLHLSHLTRIDHEWVREHATWTDGQRFRFECRCLALTVDGLCSIYEHRPVLCQAFPVGGAACRAAVVARRPGLVTTRAVG